MRQADYGVLINDQSFLDAKKSIQADVLSRHQQEWIFAKHKTFSVL
ncbi:MAG: hypothetical protein ACI85F_001354 [Bacteroidia bacterium]|jgi:hypothetical protein